MGRIRIDPWPVYTRCPACGELRHHQTLVVGHDRSRTVRCRGCGHEWTRQAGRPQTAKTSEAERTAVRHERPQREPRTCPVCGKEFVPARDSQVTCSNGCYERVRYHMGAANLLLLASRAQALDRRLREVT